LKKMSSSVVSKVLVVGDVATGKTSLIRRYVHGWFTQDHKSTIGVDFSLKTIKIDGIDCHMQMWDIAGQERFTGLARIYYRDAVGAVIVFDLTDRTTLESAASWKKDIDNKVFLKNNDPIPVLLIGNKVDLISSGEAEQCCTDDAIKAFAKENGFLGFAKTSAKDNTNVDDCFELLGNKIVENCQALEKSGAQLVQEEEPESNFIRIKPDKNIPNNPARRGDEASNSGFSCCN